MTYKIFSFVEKVAVTNPDFVKENNERVDDVIQLGTPDGITHFFSIDTSNVSIDADPASEAKTYDFSKEEDVAAIKSVVKKLITVINKIDTIEKKAISGQTLYSIALALTTENSEFAATIAAAEAEKETMLQELGLPGVSILA
jgi:hypothetical protein